MGLFSRKNSAPEPADLIPIPGASRLMLLKIGPLLPQQAVGAVKVVMNVTGLGMRQARDLVDSVRHGAEAMISQRVEVSELEASAMLFTQVGAVTRIDPPLA